MNALVNVMKYVCVELSRKSLVTLRFDIMKKNSLMTIDEITTAESSLLLAM